MMASVPEVKTLVDDRALQRTATTMWDAASENAKELRRWVSHSAAADQEQDLVFEEGEEETEGVGTSSLSDTSGSSSAGGAAASPSPFLSREGSSGLSLQAVPAFIKKRGLIRAPRGVPRAAPTLGPCGRPMSEFLTRFHLGKLLGSGASGDVWECSDRRTCRQLACKIVMKERLPTWRDVLRVRMEYEMQRRVAKAGSCHVALAEELFEDAGCFCIVMERCSGGDLFDLVSRVAPLAEAEAAAMFAQVVAAVRACHQEGVLHRDIKLENVLVSDTTIQEHMASTGLSASAFLPPQQPDTCQLREDQSHDQHDSQHQRRYELKIPQQRRQRRWQRLLNLHRLHGNLSCRQVPPCVEAVPYIPVLKLADFGASLPLVPGREACGNQWGTKMYQAPEVLAGQRYGYKADTWSLGVVLYALLSGVFPFRPPVESLLGGMIRRGVYDMEGKEWAGVPADARDAVRRLLTVDPAKRASVWEISSHPWLVKHVQGF